MADLAIVLPQRYLGGDCAATLLSCGGGERVCLGKALADLEIRLLAVGLFRQLTLELEADQDLMLKIIPSPLPPDGLLVRARFTASSTSNRISTGASDGKRAVSQAPLPMFRSHVGVDCRPVAAPALRF